MVGSAESLRQTQLHSCTIELHAVQLNMPVAGQSWRNVSVGADSMQVVSGSAHHDFHRRWS